MRSTHSHAFRLLLAASVFLYPFGSVKAQEPAAKQSGGFLTAESVAVVDLKPRQVLDNPVLQMLPIEVAQAAGEKFLGMDPKKISRAVAIVEPPLGPNLFYAVVLKAEESFDLTKLAPELTAHTQPGQIAGRDCLVSRDPSAPCIMLMGGKTLVAASKGMLEKLLNKSRPKAQGVLVDLVAGRPAGDDAYAAVNLAALRPFIQFGLMQAANEIPPEFQKYTKVVNYLESVELSVNLDTSRNTRLVVHSQDESAAKELEALIAEAKELALTKIRADMQGELTRLRASDDPMERAMADYMERMSTGYTDMFSPQRDGRTTMLFDTEGKEVNQLSSVAVIGVMVALLLPAVQAAREAARRAQAMNNMKQLMLSLLNYESANGHFPAHASYSKDGKPLLSWRVHVLPYLEEGDLYDKFHLDEPWDSPHNKALIPLMPQVFLDPSSANPPEAGKANFVVPVGPGTLFEKSDKATKLRQVTDGLSNTIALLQVDNHAAVTWTKPADWELDASEPFKGLGGLHPNIILFGGGDGSVSFVIPADDTTVFKAMLTRAGGEVVRGF